MYLFYSSEIVWVICWSIVSGASLCPFMFFYSSATQYLLISACLDRENFLIDQLLGYDPDFIIFILALVCLSKDEIPLFISFFGLWYTYFFLVVLTIGDGTDLQLILRIPVLFEDMLWSRFFINDVFVSFKITISFFCKSAFYFLYLFRS